MKLGFSGSYNADQTEFFFCMKEQVLLNTNNMLVIITHFLNENSNTAIYHYSVVVHL